MSFLKGTDWTLWIYALSVSPSLSHSCLFPLSLSHFLTSLSPLPYLTLILVWRMYFFLYGLVFGQNFHELLTREIDVRLYNEDGLDGRHWATGALDPFHSLSSSPFRNSCWAEISSNKSSSLINTLGHFSCSVAVALWISSRWGFFFRRRQCRFCKLSVCFPQACK